ncbi:MAG: hypothetical protein L6416_05915 [Candidatus Omnitrophica bacterium]|nr:hypothetical protein [Candidatus Omnitrophota bacterium]
MALENWLEIGKLIKHQTNEQELEAVFGVIDRCFSDAGLKGLSSDQKFIISYQAAFEAAISFLYCHGYRPIKSGHHYIVWQCMKDLLTKDFRKTILVFENAAKKRNKLSYDTTGLASQKEADEIYEEAKVFAAFIMTKIKKTSAYK